MNSSLSKHHRVLRLVRVRLPAVKGRLSVVISSLAPVLLFTLFQPFLSQRTEFFVAFFSCQVLQIAQGLGCPLTEHGRFFKLNHLALRLHAPMSAFKNADRFILLLFAPINDQLVSELVAKFFNFKLKILLLQFLQDVGDVCRLILVKNCLELLPGHIGPLALHHCKEVFLKIPDLVFKFAQSHNRGFLLLQQ